MVPDAINFETKSDRELLLHVAQTVNTVCDKVEIMQNEITGHNKDITRLKITLYVLAAITLGTGGTVVTRFFGG